MMVGLPHNNAEWTETPQQGVNVRIAMFGRNGGPMKKLLGKLWLGGWYAARGLDIAGRWFWHKMLVAWVKVTGRSNFAFARFLLCGATTALVIHDIWSAISDSDHVSSLFVMFVPVLWMFIAWSRYRRINRIEDAIQEAWNSGRFNIRVLIDIKACVWDRVFWLVFDLGFFAMGGYRTFFLYDLFFIAGSQFVATDINLGGKSVFARGKEKAKAALHKVGAWRPVMPPLPAPVHAGMAMSSEAGK